MPEQDAAREALLREVAALRQQSAPLALGGALRELGEAERALSFRDSAAGPRQRTSRRGSTPRVDRKRAPGIATLDGSESAVSRRKDRRGGRGGVASVGTVGSVL